MARSSITATTQDLVSDGGSILFSLILGEQQEMPIKLEFIEDARAGYEYEAVLIEAENSAPANPPVTPQPNGVKTNLSIRLPNYVGNWDPLLDYNAEEVVMYGGVYYKLTSGNNRVNITIPPDDPLWIESSLNEIYVQFPSSLATNWSLLPTISKQTFGFFELRVTEPLSAVYPHTWKPVRGLVRFYFSPTSL